MGYWNEINDVEVAKGAIVSGYDPIYKKFEGSYVGELVIEIIHNKLLAGSDKVRVLDFGCGLGRIIKYLYDTLSINDLQHIEIYGYDFPNMIDMTRKYLDDKIWKETNWINNPIQNLQNLTTNKELIKFDVVIASIVFQHINENELQDVLETLRNIMKQNSLLVVHNRGYLDDEHKNAWKIINKYFEAESRCNIEDDSENHQKVLFKKRM